jgi:anaerobic selenocysteine-containing dehydrogenase
MGEDNMSELQTKEGKITLYIAAMDVWLTAISPETEKVALNPDSYYPFVLNGGRHKPKIANNLMRKLDWHNGGRTCTLAVKPADADRQGILYGEMVKLMA